MSVEYYPFTGFDGETLALSLQTSDGVFPAAFPNPVNHTPWDFYDLSYTNIGGGQDASVTTGVREITLTVNEGNEESIHHLIGKFNVCASGPGKKIRMDYSSNFAFSEHFSSRNVYAAFQAGSNLMYAPGNPASWEVGGRIPMITTRYGDSATGNAELDHMYYRYTFDFYIYLSSAFGGWCKMVFSEV